MSNNKPSKTPSSVADYRDLYIIIGGILLGTLLGPGVLGRLSPDNWRHLFEGGIQESRDWYAFQKKGDIFTVRIAKRELEEKIARLQTIDASPQAIQEKQQSLQQCNAELRKLEYERNELILNMDSAQKLRQIQLNGLQLGLILVLGAVMIIQTIIDPLQGPTAAATGFRLTTARYVLIAVWLAVLLARFNPLKEANLLFVGILLVVVLLAAWLPAIRAKKA